MSAAALLAEGVAALGLELPDGASERLLTYLDLLEKWNRVYNLTAVRERDKMVVYHLLDSLAVLPYVSGKRVADIGTGAGLPGMVLAMVDPQRQYYLVESNSKRTTFMQQVRMQLKLDNVEIIARRVEDWQPAEKIDCIMSRAFAELELFIRLTRHLLAPGGMWLALKGQYPADELVKLNDVRLVQSIKLAVPMLEGERHVLKLEPTST